MDLEVPERLSLPFEILVQIRESARHYLFEANDWTSYYYALCLHMLGSLKFDSLSPTARQVAFWGSAAILKIIQDPPDCSTNIDNLAKSTENKPVDKSQSSSKYEITIQDGQGIVIGDRNQVTQTFNNPRRKRNG
jgi:TusA-related sulfurtransferase